MNLKTISQLLLLCSLSSPVSAQYLNPVTRFHADDNMYSPYSDEFFSGFVQSADADSFNGFLQMPYVGDPLLVYVGEKDSTQYMAYASDYRIKRCNADAGDFDVYLIRYGITGHIESHPTYAVQEYSYPDTLADKGLLIDLDQVTTGLKHENLDVKLIDKYTLCASKRISADISVSPLFYYARFSHPFTTWNIRRERIKLENGEKEARCKVALTFSLKPMEKLVVASAVSRVSLDEADARLVGHVPQRHPENVNLPSSRIKYRFDEVRGAAESSKKNYASVSKIPAVPSGSVGKPSVGSLTADFIEIITRDAELRAAFYAACSLLMQQPECRGILRADEFFKAIAPFYLKSAEPRADVDKTDAQLHQYAKNLFSGKRMQLQLAEASWYVFNAIGFRPSNVSGKYDLVRPLFNVVTLHLSNDRRFMMYTKNNSAKNRYVDQISIMHNPLVGKAAFTHDELLRGGTMEVRMTSVQGKSN